MLPSIAPIGPDAPQALPLVIVGAGLAAWTVAREMRKLDTQRSIVMLSSDSADFYAKPTLSNALAQKRFAALAKVEERHARHYQSVLATLAA